MGQTVGLTAQYRLQRWATGEASVRLECRPDPHADGIPRWWGEATFAGGFQVVAESGPNETAEDCCRNLIDRLQLGGLSIP